MKGAPDKKGPVSTMPKTTDEEDDPYIAVEFPTAVATAATQGYVEVVFEPR